MHAQYTRTNLAKKYLYLATFTAHASTGPSPAAKKRPLQPPLTRYHATAALKVLTDPHKDFSPSLPSSLAVRARRQPRPGAPASASASAPVLSLGRAKRRQDVTAVTYVAM